MAEGIQVAALFLIGTTSSLACTCSLIAKKDLAANLQRADIVVSATATKVDLA